MRPTFLFLIAFIAGLLVAETADARGRWFGRRRGRTYYTSGYSGSGVTFGGSDQQRCAQKAAYCAARGICAHVGTPIGAWEGAGYRGSTANCQTCRPPSGMVKTGDASVYGPWGWFRVVSYR